MNCEFYVRVNNMSTRLIDSRVKSLNELFNYIEGVYFGMICTGKGAKSFEVIISNNEPDAEINYSEFVGVTNGV